MTFQVLKSYCKYYQQCQKENNVYGICRHTFTNNGFVECDKLICPMLMDMKYIKQLYNKE